ncbi:MAG: NAD(P)-dependent oxidoreductase [Solirubrobacteraceae bacterium]
MSDVGFVGLGAMGSRLAGRLLAAGHRVYATNRTRSRATALIDRGLIWVDTPREAAAAAPIVFSMVSDDHALASISSGVDGILAGLAPGAVYVDMSTVGPQTSVSIAERVSILGARMLDAPVSGSIPQAETGTLAIMVGGDAGAFHLAEPLLRELGASVTHIGVNGQGLVLKLAINISLAVQPLAFGEGLLLAQRSGIEPDLAAEVMSATAVGSPMLRARVPLFLDPEHEPWFDLELMHKDIELALSAAEDVGVAVPSAALAERELERAMELGHQHRDIAALAALAPDPLIR